MSQDTLNKAKKSGARIFNINVENEKQTVIFKSTQYHPVTDQVIHVDLYGVDMKQAVLVKIQLILTGNALGVLNEGGVLVQSLNELEIECLPGDIPENIEIDISNLELGNTLRVEDITLDEKFSLKTNTEQVIASVTQAMKEEETIPDLDEGEEGVEGEEGIEGEEGDEDKSDSSQKEDTKKEEKNENSDKKTNKE
tara:strand:- start:176 stop:763 length:588 start_codon:yes stop_codon:yes gene_type:complete